MRKVEEIDEDISRKINQLKLDIIRSEKEIESLQQQCSHKKIKVDLRERALVKVCRGCGKWLGYPNKEETKDSGYI